MTIKGYVVRGTWGERKVHCEDHGGKFGDAFDAHLFDDLEEAGRARSFMARKRAPDARIFAVAEDGSESPLPTHKEALKTADAARSLAFALAPWRYEGSIEGEGAADVVTAHRALCVALFGDLAPPIAVEEQAAWERRRAEQRAIRGES
jgi:hypothetical protein